MLYMLTIMGLIGFILESCLIKGVFVPSLRTAEIFRCHPPLVSSRNKVWGAREIPPHTDDVSYKDLGRASDWSCHQRNLLRPIRGRHSDLYSDFHSMEFLQSFRGHSQGIQWLRREISVFKRRKKRERCSSLKVSWNDRIILTSFF